MSLTKYVIVLKCPNASETGRQAYNFQLIHGATNDTLAIQIAAAWSGGASF